MLKFFKKEKKVVGPFADFSQVPNDTLRSILLFLDERSVGRCQLVSRQWREVTSSDAFWIQKCSDREYDLNFIEQKLENFSWKERYIALFKDENLRLKALYGDHFEDSKDCLWDTNSYDKQPGDLPILKAGTITGILNHLYHPKINDVEVNNAVLGFVTNIFPSVQSFLETTASKTTDAKVRSKIRKIMVLWHNNYNFGKLGVRRKFHQNLEKLPEYETIIENIISEKPQPQASDLSISSLQISATYNKKYDDPNLKLLDIAVPDLARQFCIWEQELQDLIQFSEFRDQNWAKGNASVLSPNLLRAIRRFNTLMYWFAGEIIETVDLNARISVLTRIIQLADELIKLGNIATTMVLIAAWNTNPIYRLRKTQAGLSSKIQERRRFIEDLFSAEKNCKNLRRLFKSHNGPLVPYLGLFLTDITFIVDGNPRLLDAGQLNLRAITLQYKVIRDFKILNSIKYGFEKIPPIQAILNRIETSNPRTDERQLYDNSLGLEPRGQ